MALQVARHLDQLGPLRDHERDRVAAVRAGPGGSCEMTWPSGTVSEYSCWLDVDLEALALVSTCSARAALLPVQSRDLDRRAGPG